MQAPPADGPDDDEGGGIFAEVTITPLTDVILVLLIIVMVSSTAMVEAARQGRIDVELPRAGAGAAEMDDSKVLLIGILKDGRISVGDEVVDEERLEELLKERHAKEPQTFIVLDADGDLAHRVVVRVLDQARRIGFQNVGIGVAEGAP